MPAFVEAFAITVGTIGATGPNEEISLGCVQTGDYTEDVIVCRGGDCEDWYARASGARAFVNGARADCLGLPSDHPLRFAADIEALWDAHLVFLHPEDQPISSRNWAEQIQTGRPRDDQFRILGADGKYRWFLTRAEPLRDSDGKVRYWVGVNIDIDDKKRASEALDAARQRIGRATQSAAIAELSASLSDRRVQPLAAVVANARATLNWHFSDNLNISQTVDIDDAMQAGRL